MEFYQPAQRYNRANYQREEYCYYYLEERLDLRNINWLSKAAGEWEALEMIARRIALLMRYNARIEINGKPITIVEFWEVVKHIEYAPGFDDLYFRLMRPRRKKCRIKRVQWPIKPIIQDDLLNAVYNRVYRTMNKDLNHEPARKFHTDDLILSEEDKQEYQARQTQRKAKAAAKAARRRKNGGKV